MQHNSLGAKGIKNKVVIIPAPKSLICKCDGFKKKELKAVYYSLTIDGITAACEGCAN